MSYGYLKTEKDFLSWLRSSLRSVWSKHPVKLNMLQKKRVRIKVGNKMIYHLECSVCKKLHKMSNIEVNHKNTVGSFSTESFGKFAERLLLVSEADLEIVCKPCHAVITYSERYGVSIRDATIEKKIILFSKLSDKEQKDKLKKVGIKPDKDTKKARAECVRKWLRENLK